MAEGSVQGTSVASSWKRMQKFVSGSAAVALLSGMLVVAGIGVQSAVAAGPPAPKVTATVADTPLWGEDVTVNLNIQSPFKATDAGAQDAYNLSLGIVLPKGVVLDGKTTLGVPTVFPVSETNRVVPGAYAKFPTDCVAFGLEPVPGQANSCQVPEGMTYAVFTNISDLPAGAATQHSIKVRPDATLFPIGSALNATISAFTSNQATMVPVFPGIKSVATTNSHTSAPATVTLDAPVKGLRVSKAQTEHPDNKVLRGVHGDNGTIYSLTINHTGQADLDNAEVVDFLPAGLEYLGSCGIDDHSTNANGTRGEGAEYPGAGALNTASVGDNCLQESSVETILMDAATAEKYQNNRGGSRLEVGKVYTKVTWQIPSGIWAMNSNDAGNAPKPQGANASSEGVAATTVIRYRAGVPLFENTLDFGGSTPDAATGAQAANLDNNRGASTRHGEVDPSDPAADKGDGEPKRYTNVAAASGSYQGAETYDANSRTIEAVDLRVIKSVNDSEFKQGGFARYTLNLATSEYTSAEVPSPGAAPYRLFDDFADGLCPVFPANVPVAHDANNPLSTATQPMPNLVLGKPNTSGAQPFQTAEAWNAAVADAGLGTACAWNSSASNTQPASTQLAGAKLSTIGFDAQSGHFYLELAVDPALLEADSRDRIVQYSAQQGVAYVKGSAEGATTSGDTVHNSVDIFGKTTSIPALDGVTSAGSTVEGNKVSGDVADGIWNASDDSAATLKANYTQLNKTVLSREAGVPAAADIAKPKKDGGPDPALWTKKASTPFAPGDEVWYRVQITPPTGTDVRNPKFTDFLPEGVEFDPVDNDNDGRPDNMWIVPSAPNAKMGTCAPTSDLDWVNTFAPISGINVSGNVLTFNLGNSCGLSDTDRFMPLNSKLEIYLKAKVTSISAFGEVDLSQNLAKYQQNNVDGEIYFLRDEAEIALDTSARLVKGIQSNTFTDPKTNTQPYLGPNAPNSNIDGQPIVQGDKVVFRLDVTAPTVDTKNYWLYDALPAGVKAEHLSGFNSANGSFTGNSTLWADNADVANSTVAYTAHAYNPGDSGYPSDVNPLYNDRSIVVWQVTGTVPGSSQEVPAVPANPNDPSSGTPAVPAVQRGFSVSYSVTVPGAADGTAAAQITQNYINTASIAEMAVVNNASAGTSTTLVPTPGAGNSTVPTGGSTIDKAGEKAAPVALRTAGANQLEVPADHATDPSNVTLPNASVSKKLISTEIQPSGSTPADPLNSGTTTGAVEARPDNAIVEGEYATFEYAATIPAKTSVAGGKLFDAAEFARNSNKLGYEFVPGSARFYQGATGTTAIDCGTGSADFKCDPATGELTLPEFYTNDTANDAVFRVQITVWVKQKKGTVTLAHNDQLVNTAHFGYNKPTTNPGIPGRADLTATANTRYLEPAPTLAKTVSGTQGADGRVKFRLTASNTANRPAVYDAVVYDCLPAGFTLPAQTFAPSAGTVDPVTPAVKCSATGTGTGTTVTQPDAQGTGTLIKWNVGRIDAGTPATLEFDAIVDTGAAGGEQYTNRAQLVGKTLPNTLPQAEARAGTRNTGASANVNIANASLAKSVTPNRAPVGETVTYTMRTTVPAHANYYFFEISDLMPAGLEFVDGSATLNFVGGPNIAAQPKVSGSVKTGQTLVWPANGRVEIPTAATERTIVITYQAKITDQVASAQPTNRANASWNTNKTADEGTRKATANATAPVTILNPSLTLQKQVKLVGADDASYAKTKQGDPNQGFTYRVRVSNANTTPAYHAAITDCLPAGVIDVTSVSNGGSYSASAAAGCANGTITWTDLGPIPAGGSIDLTFNATFAASAELRSTNPTTTGSGVAEQNIAKIVEYTSYGTNGETGWTYRPGGKLPGGANMPAALQDDASVTPLFPYLVPTKTVTNPVAGQSYGLAHSGNNFNWTLTLRNAGVGTANSVSVTDVLPVNWEYVGNAQISVNGGPSLALLGAPNVTTATAGGGEQQTVTWTESQLNGAEATPLAAGRSIVITFDAKPTKAALTTPGTGVIGNGGKVNVHRNTLTATATDANDASRNKNATSYVGPQSQADAYIAEADLQLTKTAVPTSAVVAGSGEFAAWDLVVRNSGPDSAEGPIRVKDTTGALPDGITITGASGTGWNCTVGPRAANGATEIDCARTTLNEALPKNQSFPKITVRAKVAAAQQPITVNNSAIVVPGATFDPNYVSDPAAPGYNSQNNRSEASLSTTTAADLALVKSLTSPTQVPNRGVVVGGQMTWQLAVTNIGLSDSISSSEKPITITDTVPAGIASVADPSNASWTASVTRAGAAAQFPAKAGDKITWTFTGASIPFGATSTVSVSGTILTSHVGDVTNTAVVLPGETPEPNRPDASENNTSTTTTPTDSSTEIGVRKARVVADASAADGWRQADPSTNPDDAFVAGSPVYYRITTTNLGSADARNVHVVDEAPEGLTFASVTDLSGSWSASPVTATNWHDFALQGGTMPVGESRAFVVRYETASTITGAVVNWAEASADNATSVRDKDDTNATKIVDLGIEKSHEGDGPFTPGTTVSYTLKVTNHGPSSTSGDVEIVDTLPAGLSYVAGSANATSTVTGRSQMSAEPSLSGDGDRTLTWNLLEALDVFDVGQTVTVTFDVMIDPSLRAGTPLNNVATVDGPDDQTEPDPDPHPNRATDLITTTGTTASMSVEKKVQNSSGDWGESAELIAGTAAKWQVTVINEGPSAAPVSLSDILPAGVSFVSVSGAGWACTEANGVPTGVCSYTANNGLHPVGEANATTIEIETMLAPELRPTQEPGVPALVNTAQISWSDDTTAGVQTARDTASVTIANDADLSIVKNVLSAAGGDVVAEQPAPVTAGESVWYRLQVANLGASDASGPVVVTDTLPIGLTVTAGTSTVNGWTMKAEPVVAGSAQIVTFSLSGGQLAATAADAARGNAPVIEFEAQIDPAVADGETLVNSATVTSATPDSNPDNNADSADVLVMRSADLSITKSHPTADDRDRVVIGEALPFLINVTNHGPSVSSGFTVTDTMPIGLEVTDQLGAVLDDQGDPTGWTIESITPEQWDATQPTVVVASYTGLTAVGADTTPLVLNTIVHENTFSEADDVVNHVQITAANEIDPEPSNNEFEDPIHVRPLVTLVIEKKAVGEFKVGKVGTYSITVENTGTQTDHGPITVTDSLPAGLSFRDAPDLPEGATATHERGVVTWTLTEPLPAGEKVTLTLNVNVLQAAYDQPSHQLVNVASVTTESSITDDSVLTDDAVVTVKPADALVNTGGEIAGGLLAAIALMGLLGGASYLAGRKRSRARHA